MLLQMIEFQSLYDWIICLCIYTHHIFFSHSSIYQHLGWFLILAVVHSAALNTGVLIALQILIFFSFEYIRNSGIPGLRIASLLRITIFPTFCKFLQISFMFSLIKDTHPVVVASAISLLLCDDLIEAWVKSGLAMDVDTIFFFDW